MASKEWVLIVGGSILQWPAVRAARELGYKVMLTDRNPACYCASLVERFVELSTFDVAGHVLLARVNSDDLAAIFTAGADPIVTRLSRWREQQRQRGVMGCRLGLRIRVLTRCIPDLL
jgi:uncharacterized protein YmfQ (DUF2313 family)